MDLSSAFAPWFESLHHVASIVQMAAIRWIVEGDGSKELEVRGCEIRASGRWEYFSVVNTIIIVFQ